MALGLRSWLSKMWADFFACTSNTMPSRFFGAVMCWYRKSEVVDTISCSVRRCTGRVNWAGISATANSVTIGTKIGAVRRLVLYSFRVHVDRHGLDDDAGGRVVHVDDLSGFFVVVGDQMTFFAHVSRNINCTRVCEIITNKKHDLNDFKRISAGTYTSKLKTMSSVSTDDWSVTCTFSISSVCF